MPYKTVLPERDINAGWQIVQALKQKGVAIDAAVWYYDEDSDEWKLMIVSPDVASKGPLTLRRLLRPLREEANQAEFSPLGYSLGQTILTTDSDLRYQYVKRGLGLRFARGTPRDIIVEDVYEYKV